MKRLIVSTIACLALVQPAAALAERPAPRAKKPHTKQLPPHYEQWLRTCHAEQPKPGGRGKWGRVWWKQTVNYSYKGGCGFTQLNWDQFKRAGQPKYMSDATPLEQLWACERIYQHYARIGGPAYGASVWDANATIGFHGFAKDVK